MQNLDKKAIRSGVMYTFSNFLTKGLVFLSTPIFARIMSIQAFGEYSAFTTWQALLLCILPLGLDATVARARLDFPGKLEEYMSSVAVASVVFSIAAYGVVMLFADFFMDLFKMNMTLIHIMFVYMILYPALTLFQARNSAEFRYKVSTAISLSSAILSLVLAIAFSWVFEDQMLGRVIGYDGVYIVFCAVLLVYILWKGRTVKWEYIRYGLRLALPYVPHIVGIYLLASADKLVIQELRGEEAVAFYNIGFTCAVVISMLSNSVNSAMSPWLYQSLHDKNYAKIKSVNKVYVGAFVFVTVGLLLIAPEIMLIIGGEKYRQAQGVLMPIMAGCCCNFIYTSYVNVETFLKKPGMISVGTVTTAAIKIVLNFIFVDLYGYEAAAYTTMVCYMLLLLLHYGMVRHYKYHMIYDNKFNMLCAVGICIFSLFIRMTYLSWIRLALIVVYAVAAIVVLWKFKDQILSLVKSVLKK